MLQINGRTCKALTAFEQITTGVHADGALFTVGVAHVHCRPRYLQLDHALVRWCTDRVLPNTVPIASELVLIEHQPTTDATAQAHREFVADLCAGIEMHDQLHRLAAEG